MSECLLTEIAEEQIPELPAHISKTVKPGKYVRISNEKLFKGRSIYFEYDYALKLAIRGTLTTNVEMVERINSYVGNKPYKKEGRTRKLNDKLLWSIHPSMMGDLIRIVLGVPSLDDSAENQIDKIVENPNVYLGEVVSTARKLKAYPQSGFVYAAKSTDPLHPEIVKLGVTRQPLPEDRLKTLNNTSVVYDFELITSYWVVRWLEAEVKVHNYFAVQRIRMDREFFRLTSQQQKSLDFTTILGEQNPGPI